jgi:hypothetical protein
MTQIAAALFAWDAVEARSDWFCRKVCQLEG